jgi:two-component system response regulator YesN
MYRVLLADDEEEIRESMAYRVDWSSLGFEIVAYAENGMEALEQLEKEMPDVIMTDIRMPFLSGLEFVEKAVEIRPTVKIIIFSGFDDFEYAQKAITLNVEAYMLKPISASQLSKTLDMLRKKMDAEVEEQQNIEKLRKNYVKSLPIMREQFYISWVEGRISKDEVSEKARQYQIELGGSVRTVVTFRVNPSLTCEERKEEETPENLIPIALKKTVDAVLGRFHGIHSFIYVDHVVVITELEWESQIKMLMNEVNEVCKNARTFTGRIITAGIGGMYQKAEAVHSSYQEANSALEYGTLLCKDGEYATYIHDIEPDHNARVVPNQSTEQQLLGAIKLGRTEVIKSKIQQLFTDLEGSCMPFGLYQVYVLQILASILGMGMDYGEICREELDHISQVMQMYSLEQMKEWLTRLCLKLADAIRQEQMDSREMIVSRAKALVEEHYGDADLSAEKICEQLHVSTAYFSTVFKKEEKINFVSYLTDVRMKHAVHLLETTSDKTYLIAAKVGYGEPNYFSYVFKKKYGLSPSRYRSRQTKTV